MTSRTRVPTAELTGLSGALMKRVSKKRMGEVPAPLGVMWHNRTVLKVFFGFGPKGRQGVETMSTDHVGGSSVTRVQVRVAYESYLTAFINADLAGIDAVVSYPLAHIGDAGVRLFDTFPINPADLKAAKGWHTTVNSRYEVVAVSDRKAHVILYSADRVREDGSLIETVSAFYAFTRTDTGWKLYAISDVVNPASHDASDDEAPA